MNGMRDLNKDDHVSLVVLMTELKNHVAACELKSKLEEQIHMEISLTLKALWADLRSGRENFYAKLHDLHIWILMSAIGVLVAVISFNAAVITWLVDKVLK